MLLLQLCIVLVYLELDGVERVSYSNPRPISTATDTLDRTFIFKSQIRAIGSKPRTQSAVNDTAECAILASGTAAGLIHDPFLPSYCSQK